MHTHTHTCSLFSPQFLYVYECVWEYVSFSLESTCVCVIFVFWLRKTEKRHPFMEPNAEKIEADPHNCIDQCTFAGDALQFVPGSFFFTNLEGNKIQNTQKCPIILFFLLTFDWKLNLNMLCKMHFRVVTFKLELCSTTILSFLTLQCSNDSSSISLHLPINYCSFLFVYINNFTVFFSSNWLSSLLSLLNLTILHNNYIENTFLLIFHCNITYQLVDNN